MKYYTNLDEMTTMVKDIIIEADENVENYDIAEILDEVSDYDFDRCALYFTDAFEDGEEFWEIAEKYRLDKDYSEFSNDGLLDQLNEAILDGDEFIVEQLRNEILKRMN